MLLLLLSRGLQGVLAGHLTSLFTSLVLRETLLRDTSPPFYSLSCSARRSCGTPHLSFHFSRAPRDALVGHLTSLLLSLVLRETLLWDTSPPFYPLSCSARRSCGTPHLPFTLSRAPRDALAGHLTSLFTSLVLRETLLRDTSPLFYLLSCSARRSCDAPHLSFTLSRAPRDALVGHLTSLLPSLVLRETLLRCTSPLFYPLSCSIGTF